jgi:cytochrome oxidase Cu insertion factor (SCO1/SenC/PrrC family)
MILGKRSRDCNEFWRVNALYHFCTVLGRRGGKLSQSARARGQGAGCRFICLSAVLEAGPETIARAFRVYARQVPGGKPGDYGVDHSGAVYLMDKRGKFVSVFNLQRPPREAARELERYL